MTEPKQPLLLQSGTCCVVEDSSVDSQATISEMTAPYQVWKTITNAQVRTRTRRRRCGRMFLPLKVALILLSTLVALASSSSSSIPQRQPKNDDDKEECNLYLAPSTIPGAGFGMFSGSKSFKNGEQLALPDIMIPTYDMEWHNGHKEFSFLWEEYTWSACKWLLIHGSIVFYLGGRYETMVTRNIMMVFPRAIECS
jgi:hypothetical protein